MPSSMLYTILVPSIRILYKENPYGITWISDRAKLPHFNYQMCPEQKCIKCCIINMYFFLRIYLERIRESGFAIYILTDNLTTSQHVYRCGVKVTSQKLS